MARNNKSPYLVVMTKVGVQDKHNHARWIKMGQWYTWTWVILRGYQFYHQLQYAKGIKNIKKIYYIISPSGFFICDYLYPICRHLSLQQDRVICYS